jgi:hypothetical protein
MAFAIGSLPHVDMQAALDLILERLGRCPHWPQLPARSFLEQMEYQFSGFLPGVTVDEQGRRLVVDQHGDTFLPALERFWERALAAEQGRELEHFGVSEAYAPGLFALESRLWGGDGPPFVKGQCTGPFTLGLGLTTTDDRALYYDDTMRDVVIRAVALHARWQARRLSRLGGAAIMAVDEPVLTSFGSTAMITVSREQVVSALGEAADSLHAEGALMSTHCCGNTDWSMMVDAGVDILSFDAWEYGEKMALYAREIARLFERGGWLAWGVVPSRPEILDVTAERILERLHESQSSLAAHGLDAGTVEERTLLTPSCGTGPLTVHQAVRAYELLEEVESRWDAAGA